MGIATTMVVDYEDNVYQYTPRQYWVEVRNGNRLLAGGPRVNTYGMEYFRLDLQYWEIDKKEVSEDGQWQTLYFRKRQAADLVIVKEQSSRPNDVFYANGYEEVDGKYYIFSNDNSTEVIDGAEWTVKETRFSYPGYARDALVFTKKVS